MEQSDPYLTKLMFSTVTLRGVVVEAVVVITVNHPW